MSDRAEMLAPTPGRVAPEVTDQNRFFWTGGLSAQLLLLTCDGCAYRVHPPAPYCPACGSRSVSPQPVSGRGTIYSYTVNRRDWGAQAAPYVFAIVELDEQPGLRLTTNIVGCGPDAVDIGMRVEVAFERCGEFAVPLFKPVSP